MVDKYLVGSELTVKQTIEVMENQNIKAVLIVDNEKKIMGMFANGDMRSFFLKGGKLSANITTAMNPNPILYLSRHEVEEENKNIHRVLYPIVDSQRHVVDVIDYGQGQDNSIVNDALKNIPLVIMAGGKGTRLYPYTKVLPKPLIPIGDLTITERIIDKFRRFGCQKVHMVLNYKANMIRAYMNELEKDYTVDYIEEGAFLGTAGGLRLLKDSIKSTFFVSNCDILIDADFECIYKTHKKKGNKITFICSMKDVVIPYGVIETAEDGSIQKMREKPGFSFLINTGLYMLEPEVLEDIKDGEFIHMPDLAQRYMDRGEKVGVFPISEKSWLDMGQFSEMENMMNALGVK